MINLIKCITTSFCLSFLFINQIFAQDSVLCFRCTWKETALFSGYSLNFGDTANKKSHILELGIWKTKYIAYIEPFNTNYYFSNEFVLHDSKLAIGPKIGAYIGFLMFCIGSEIIFYTNFRENALRLSPYIGLGSHNFKLTINPLLNLYNKDFNFINPITFSLTFQIITLSKRKL